MALCLAILLLLGAAPAIAESPVRIISSDYSYSFSSELQFFLQAESNVAIEEIILFYGREDALQGRPRLVRRIYPDFAPGTRVQVQYREELERGQYAPGTMLRFWWRVTTEDGAEVDSEPQRFEYIDTATGWQTLSDERVSLYWYGNERRRAEALLKSAEEALARIEQDIGVPVEQRVSVYVYNSQRDMARALSPRSAGYEESIITLGVVVDQTTLLLLGSHRGAIATLAHELCHVVVGLAVDNPYTDIPRWLDEGLAMYAEQELPIGNRGALERAIRNDTLLTLRSMTSYSGQASEVDLYYGQAYSVVDFMLREFGRDKMVELLGVFAEGTRQEDALQRVFGIGLDALNDAWRVSLGLDPLSADAPAMTPTRRPFESEQQARSWLRRGKSFGLEAPWICNLEMAH